MVFIQCTTKWLQETEDTGRCLSTSVQYQQVIKNFTSHETWHIQIFISGGICSPLSSPGLSFTATQSTVKKTATHPFLKSTDTFYLALRRAKSMSAISRLPSLWAQFSAGDKFVLLGGWWGIQDCYKTKVSPADLNSTFAKKQLTTVMQSTYWTRECCCMQNTVYITWKCSLITKAFPILVLIPSKSPTSLRQIPYHCNSKNKNIQYSTMAISS